jgi:hypothetical protein
MTMPTFIGYLRAQGKRDDQVGELARWWADHGDASRSVAGVQKRVFEASDGRDMPVAFNAAVAEYETSRTPGPEGLSVIGVVPAPAAVPGIPGWAEPSEGVAWGGGGPASGDAGFTVDGEPPPQHPVTAAVRDATAAGLAAAERVQRPVPGSSAELAAMGARLPGERTQEAILDELREMHVLLLVLAQALGLPDTADGEPDHAALWAAADFSEDGAR